MFRNREIFQKRESKEEHFTVVQFQSEPPFTVTGFTPEHHSQCLIFLNPLHLEDVVLTHLTVDGVRFTVLCGKHIEGLSLTVLSEVMRPKAISRQTQAKITLKAVADFLIVIGRLLFTSLCGTLYLSIYACRFSVCYTEGGFFISLGHSILAFLCDTRKRT